MADYDLILRQDGENDIAVTDGVFSAIGPNLSGTADREIEITSGKKVFPGFIDAHVHFNEPGRAEWEGFATGSKALAAGGGTVFCDMPLNSTPPVVDEAAFERKRRVGEEKSVIDFGLWAGMIPGNEDELPRMAALGAVGAKAFMADSGLAEFPRVTPKDLRSGMQAAAKCDLLVAVHAESQEYIDAMPKTEAVSPENFSASRPIEAEVEAIRIACELAGETGCRLHIVHISSRAGIAEVEKAKLAGVDVSTETCPHYLLFCDQDIVDHGATAKCAPPLRSPREVGGLISSLVEGKIDIIGSDHSPCLPEMKSGNFAEAWGGIAGCQHAFPALLAKYPDFSSLLTINPARRMGLSDRKGSIEVGKDADFVIVDFARNQTISQNDLLYRHPISLYAGQTIDCRVEMTFCCGRQVFGGKNATGQSTIPSCSRFLARQEPA